MGEIMVIISIRLNNFMYILQDLAKAQCPVYRRGATEVYNYSVCCQSKVTIYINHAFTHKNMKLACAAYACVLIIPHSVSVEHRAGQWIITDALKVRV